MLCHTSEKNNTFVNIQKQNLPSHLLVLVFRWKKIYTNTTTQLLPNIGTKRVKEENEVFIFKLLLARIASKKMAESLDIFSDIETESDSSEITSSHNSDSSDDKSERKVGEKVVEFEMIQGKRRDRFILHSISEHQLYVRNKVLAGGSIAYTCKEKNCKARVYLKNDACFFSEPFLGHEHGNKKEEITEMKLLAEIKKSCLEPTASQTTSQISEVREIFDDAVLK